MKKWEMPEMVELKISSTEHGWPNEEKDGTILGCVPTHGPSCS